MWKITRETKRISHKFTDPRELKASGWEKVSKINNMQHWKDPDTGMIWPQYQAIHICKGKKNV